MFHTREANKRKELITDIEGIKRQVEEIASMAQKLLKKIEETIERLKTQA